MMATMQDFGGLLFGQGGSGLEEYLTPAQQQGIQNQAMLQAASALLQAGGPSTRPVSLGQALGGALQAGTAGYAQAQQGAVANLLAKQKLQEAAMETSLRKLMLGESGLAPTAGGGMAPAVTGAAPTAGATQVAGGAAPAMPTSGFFGNLTPEQRRLMAFMKPSEAIGAAFKAAGEKYQQMTPEEIAQTGLQPNAVYFKSPQGKPEVIYRPDYELTETPAGGKVWVNKNDPLGGPVPQTKVSRDVKAGAATISQPTPLAAGGGAPTYAGGFAPALKPEQISSAAQDWDKNYRSPVENILSSYNIVKDLVTTGQGGISDYGVLIKALKGLDQNSAVMQGEADSARQMQALADRMQGALDKIQAGGIGSEQARLDLANLARSSASVAIDAYNRQAERKSQLLGQYMPQAAVKSIFQPYTKPSDLTSKAEMERQMRASTVAPAAGQQVWKFIDGKPVLHIDGKPVTK
jgi:hypothetical protein